MTLNWRVTSWLSLLLTLAGPLIYGVAMTRPGMEWTRYLMWAMLALGVSGGIASAVRLKRRGPAILAVVDAGIVALVIAALLLVFRLPSAESSPGLHSSAPPFELPDHTGAIVRLTDELARGPVLLVFYRGFW